MLVGEAPAKTELKEGIPFVGQAGKQLDELLGIAQIRRSEIYITNASLEPVKGNKEQFFLPSGQPSDAYLQGITQLFNDIAEIKPNVIVPMGNYALWACMQHQNVMKWRGSILWSDVLQRKIIPTIHPAALLRGGEDKADEDSKGGMWKYRTVVAWDLGRAKEQSAYPERRLRKREIITDPLQYDAAIERLVRSGQAGKVRVFDLEAAGGLDIQLAGFSDGDPEWAVVFDKLLMGGDRFEAVLRLLLEDDTPKVGQNVCTYDIPALDQLNIRTKNLVHDTMLGAHVLVVDLPKKLEFLTSIYTDIPYYKFEGKVWKNMPREGDPREQWRVYCGKDVCGTTEIYVCQCTELTERKLWGTFKLEMQIVEPFRHMTFNGIKVDIQRLFELTNETLAKLQVEKAKLLELSGGVDLYGKTDLSPKKVAKFLYEDRKLPPRRKKGKLTTGAKQILDLAAQTGDLAPVTIVAVKRLQKSLSSYYNVKILSPDGRTRSVYNPGGTKSGRASAAKPLWGPGLNQQTLPIRRRSKARQMFIADTIMQDSGLAQEFEFWELDQMQAEAIVTAYLANDPVHMDCFRTKKHVHKVTACLMTDQPVENWKSIPKDEPIYDIAKRGNHELNYGAGPFMFMYSVNEEWDPTDPESFYMTANVAKATYAKYHQIRPALAGYWESTRNLLRNNNRTLTTPLGRERQFLDQWSDSMLRDAYAWRPQSTVADCTNIGILQALDSEDSDIQYLLKYSRGVLRGSGLINQVHDSSVWLMPIGARNLAMKFMQSFEVPIVVNGYHIVIPIEGAAGHTLYKAAMEPLGQSRDMPEEGYEESEAA